MLSATRKFGTATGIRRGEATATSTPASSRRRRPRARAERKALTGGKPTGHQRYPRRHRGRATLRRIARRRERDDARLAGDTTASAASAGSPTRATVPSGMISPPPSPETSDASVVERLVVREGGGGARGDRRSSAKTGREFAHADADAHVSLVGLVGLSPIEMVAAEVRSPPRASGETRRRGRVVVGFRLRFRGCVGRGGCGGGGGRGG